MAGVLRCTGRIRCLAIVRQTKQNDMLQQLMETGGCEVGPTLTEGERAARMRYGEIIHRFRLGQSERVTFPGLEILEVVADQSPNCG